MRVTSRSFSSVCARARVSIWKANGRKEKEEDKNKQTNLGLMCVCVCVIRESPGRWKRERKRGGVIDERNEWATKQNGNRRRNDYIYIHNLCCIMYIYIFVDTHKIERGRDDIIWRPTHFGDERGRVALSDHAILYETHLPPLLSLSAGFTWIGRFICAKKKGKTNNESTFVLIIVWTLSFHIFQKNMHTNEKLYHYYNITSRKCQKSYIQ